jgi:protein pelota
LQTFYDLLSSDPDRACYGFADVNCADDQLAIDGLLVTDKLFKAADVHHRKKYVALVESVKEHGGRVRWLFIYSIFNAHYLFQWLHILNSTHNE